MKTLKKIITVLLTLSLIGGCGGASITPEEPPEDLNDGSESMVINEDIEIETNENEDIGGF